MEICLVEMPFSELWDTVVKRKYRINASSLSPLVIPQWETGRYMQIISKLPNPTVNQVVRNDNELKIEAFGSYRQFHFDLQRLLVGSGV